MKLLPPLCVSWELRQNAPQFGNHCFNRQESANHNFDSCQLSIFNIKGYGTGKVIGAQPRSQFEVKKEDNAKHSAVYYTYEVKLLVSHGD